MAKVAISRTIHLERLRDAATLDFYVDHFLPHLTIVAVSYPQTCIYIERVWFCRMRIDEGGLSRGQPKLGCH